MVIIFHNISVLLYLYQINTALFSIKCKKKNIRLYKRLHIWKINDMKTEIKLHILPINNTGVAKTAENGICPLPS